MHNQLLNFMRSTYIRCHDVNVTYLQYLAWRQQDERNRLGLRSHNLLDRLQACRSLSCLMSTWSQSPDLGEYLFNKWRFENRTDIAHTTSVMDYNSGRHAELIGYHLNELRMIQPGFPYTIMGWDTSISARCDVLIPSKPRRVDFDLPVTHVLFTEYISSESLSDGQDMILLQIALTLRLAQDCFGFMHNRLAAKRILVYDTGSDETEHVYAWKKERPRHPIIKDTNLDQLHIKIRREYTFYTVKCRYVPYIIGLNGARAVLSTNLVAFPSQGRDNVVQSDFFDANTDMRDLLRDIDSLNELTLNEMIEQWMEMIPATKPPLPPPTATLDIIGNVPVYIHDMDDLMAVATETGAWEPPFVWWPERGRVYPQMLIPEAMTEIKQYALFYHVHVNIKQLLANATADIKKRITHVPKDIDQHMADAVWVQHKYKQMLVLGITHLPMVCDYLKEASTVFHNAKSVKAKLIVPPIDRVGCLE